MGSLHVVYVYPMVDLLLNLNITSCHQTDSVLFYFVPPLLAGAYLILLNKLLKLLFRIIINIERFLGGLVHVVFLFVLIFLLDHVEKKYDFDLKAIKRLKTTTGLVSIIISPIPFLLIVSYSSWVGSSSPKSNTSLFGFGTPPNLPR